MTPPVGEPFSYDPFGPDEMANPLPFYQELRDHHRAYFLPEYEAWAISRFDDVWQILNDREGHITPVEGTLLLKKQLLVSNGGSVPELVYDPLPVFGYTESPVHEELRQAFSPALRPGAVGRLEELIRSFARARLDVLLPQGRFNVTSEYAGVVAAQTMCHLFGLPLEEAEWVRDAVIASAPGAEDPKAQDRAYGQVIDQVTGLVAERRAAGAGGERPLIDGLVRYRLDGRELTDREIGSSVLAIVLFGGVETLPKVVSHGLIELWRAPDQRRELVADPANCAVAFEEMLRFCAPAQWFTRTVKRPITMAGEELGAGHRIFPLLMSANRDEREFDDPDTFLWDRPIARHLAFGQGQSFCVGTHLARLEGRILLEELLARAPEYEIDLDHALRPPSSFQWGYRTVPLVVG
ncbi:MAG TPA: cytochrome P450 [Acidimicrobiales bacterium]|nr:cytochrome P450 [Acidimicrobiales bacterium]